MAVLTPPEECGTIAPEPTVTVQSGFIYVDHKGVKQRLCRVSDGFVYFWHKQAKEEIKIPIEIILAES
jgi:hypothetical protein